MSFRTIGGEKVSCMDGRRGKSDSARKVCRDLKVLLQGEPRDRRVSEDYVRKLL